MISVLTRHRIGLWLLVAMTALAGCSRCGRFGPHPPRISLLQYLPRQAAAVVMAPDLDVLGSKIRSLQRLKVASFAAQLQGLSSADEYADALMAALGLDLRSPAALREAGIDAARGAALVLLGEDRVYGVVGVADPARFETTVAVLAQNRLAATQRGTRSLGAEQMTTFSRPGEPPVVGLVVSGGLGFVAGRGVLDQLPQLIALEKSRSLADDPDLAAALGRFKAPQDLLAFIPSGSRLSGSWPPPVATTLGLLIGPTAISLRAVLAHLSAADLDWARAQPVATDLTFLVPEDAFLIARYQGDPRSLSPVWPKLLGRVAAKIKASGFDPDREVLNNLEPGAVLSLSLAPSAAFGGGLPALDVRRTNPFRFVQLVAAGTPRDDGQVDPALERLVQAAPAMAFTANRQSSDGRTVVRTTYAQGEGLSIAHDRGRVILAAPSERLDQAVAQLRHGPAKSPTDLWGPEHAQEAATAVLDLGKLSDAIRGLPSEAWGVGGFAIKSAVIRWLDATDDLRSISMGVRADGDVLELGLVLKVSAP